MSLLNKRKKIHDEYHKKMVETYGEDYLNKKLDATANVKAGGTLKTVNVNNTSNSETIIRVPIKINVDIKLKPGESITPELIKSRINVTNASKIINLILRNVDYSKITKLK